MTRREFHSLLRLLQNIDHPDFLAAGIKHGQWLAFCGNPHHWFMHAREADMERIWVVIERRHLKSVRCDARDFIVKAKERS